VAGSRRPVDPGDFARADLEQMGFVGFVTVRALRSKHPYAGDVPDDCVGVYVAYRESDRPVSFLRASPAGRWRGDPTLPTAALHKRWVPASRIVYIGRAERLNPTSVNSLHKRVTAYLRFGAGSNARHSGGYPTWQLRDSADLLIAWHATRVGDSAALESALIDAHLARFGALPFGNSVKA
jgi:hypothetical protein